MIFNNRTWLSWNQQASIHLLYLTLQAARQELPNYFGFSWPLTILLYEGDQVYWMNRWEELRALGAKMLDCLLVPGYQRYFYKEEFPQKSQAVECAIETLDSIDLSKLSDAQLIEEYSKFTRLYKSWYAIGWYAEPVQFCAEAIMEDELRYLRDSHKVKEEDIVEAKPYLYSSMELTYATEIEESLLNCARTLFEAFERTRISVSLKKTTPDYELEVKRCEGDLSTTSIFAINEFYKNTVQVEPDFNDARTAIEEHSKRFFWKRNNYFSTQVVLPHMVLQECVTLGTRHSLSELASKIGEAARRLTDNQNLRHQVYRELRPYYRTLVDILSENAQMKDSRKKTISLANHAVDSFLQEVAKRTGYSLEEIRRLLPEEISECLDNPNALREEIASRVESTVIFWGEQDTAPSEFTFNPSLRSVGGFSTGLTPADWLMQSCLITSGKTARELIRKLNDKFRFMLDWGQGQQLDSISGECAFARIGEDELQGTVRIIRDPKNAPDFQEGDILVAPSTTPDYVPIIRHASCIITDWGGWTSHAALCAREFGIPCIIGTYHASQVLSSGETITVRVREGVVLRHKNGGRNK